MVCKQLGLGRGSTVLSRSTPDPTSLISSHSLDVVQSSLLTLRHTSLGDTAAANYSKPLCSAGWSAKAVSRPLDYFVIAHAH